MEAHRVAGRAGWRRPLQVAAVVLLQLAMPMPRSDAVSWDARWEKEVHKLFSEDYMTYSRLRDVIFGGWVGGWWWLGGGPDGLGWGWKECGVVCWGAGRGAREMGTRRLRPVIS